MVATAGFVTYDLHAFRGQVRKDTLTHAQIMSWSCSGDLAKGNFTQVEQILNMLFAEPDIDCAAAYDIHGQRRAYYLRDEKKPIPPERALPSGEYFREGYLVVSRKIEDRDKLVGWLYLRQNMREWRTHQMAFAGIVAGVFLLAALFALLVSVPLQRMLTEPLIALASIIQNVAGTEEEEAQPEARTQDEIGSILDGVHAILAEMRERDEALLVANATLEERVRERTEALEHANADLGQAYEATIEGWSRALDLRDQETEGHTQRVTEMTVKLARAAGIPEEEILHIRRGALLHDIGKMGIPDSILLKPGKLTDQEWVIMRKHPVFAFEVLSPIDFLRPALDIPLYHHERWDGTGYPYGLSGEDIPLGARLFAVVDVWDALRSDRPYRPAWPEDKVIDHIRRGCGSHFDPQAVRIFLEMVGVSTQKPLPLAA